MLTEKLSNNRFRLAASEERYSTLWDEYIKYSIESDELMEYSSEHGRKSVPWFAMWFISLILGYMFVVFSPIGLICLAVALYYQVKSLIMLNRSTKRVRSGTEALKESNKHLSEMVRLEKEYNALLKEATSNVN